MMRKLLFKTNNIARSSYFWNATAGGLNALQSVVILMVINRVLDETASGVFSIAWSISYLVYTLARFGMRNYQVTDANNLFTINEYFSSRFITTALMLMAGIAYTMYGRYFLHYTLYKCTVVLLICVWKVIDSFEDVLHAWYQKEGRLDVAGKAMSVRYLVGLIALLTSLILTKNLIYSILSCIVFSFIVFYFCKIKLISEFGQIIIKAPNKNVIRLLRFCLPLCIGEFLSIYIGNAPKLAIDTYLTEEMQAIFNFIFMPVFAIGLLASFIYNPIVASLGEAWEKRQFTTVKQTIRQQSIIIICITIVVVIAGQIAGVQVLGILYSTDLTTYKTELCILLIGGGMMALSGLFVVILVTLRKQNKLILGYGISSTVALALSTYCVRNNGLMGAAVSYLLTTCTLVVVLVVVVVKTMKAISIENCINNEDKVESKTSNEERNAHR